MRPDQVAADTIPDRVRINSPTICPNSWSDWLLSGSIFSAPFGPLIYTFLVQIVLTVCVTLGLVIIFLLPELRGGWEENLSSWLVTYSVWIVRYHVPVCFVPWTCRAICFMYSHVPPSCWLPMRLCFPFYIPGFKDLVLVLISTLSTVF